MAHQQSEPPMAYQFSVPAMGPEVPQPYRNGNLAATQTEVFSNVAARIFFDCTAALTCGQFVEPFHCFNSVECLPCPCVLILLKGMPDACPSFLWSDLGFSLREGYRNSVGIPVLD
jgi:hypothetical protein